MRIVLFTGKGGVGKTTVAAATAARVAERGGKVLALSADPAHSLGDALAVPLEAEPREVELGDGGSNDEALSGDAGSGAGNASLHAAEIHTRSLVDQTWGELRDHLRTVLAGAGVTELDAAELTALPGVEELLSLLEVQRLAASGVWDTVIVDCGPTAETLRLLALPESVSGYLERLFPAHRRAVRGLLAGVAGSGNVERWDATADALGRLAQRLSSLNELLTDAETSVRVVLSPESVVAAETRRTLTALALRGIRVDGLVVNRMVPDVGSARGTAAAWLRTRGAQQHEIVTELRTSTGLPVRTVGYRASEPVGASALARLGEELYVDDDPLGHAERAPEMQLTGGGRDLDAEYGLRIALPLHADADVDLARVGDELAVSIDGRRRLIALPPVLRRCIVTGATAGDDGVSVAFRPDPEVWMR